jgi:hypothetical protein
MRGTLVLAAALFFGAAAPTEVERLDPDHQPLVRDFQEGKGRARLIAILSPT